MGYLLIYFSIGIAFSSLMAILPIPRRLSERGELNPDPAIGVFVFLALVWPLNFIAFFVGVVSQLVTRARRPRVVGGNLESMPGQSAEHSPKHESADR